MKTLNATTVADLDKKQYHIGCKPGELAENILLVGDPARVKKAAARMEKVRLELANREFVVVTGNFRGLELSVMATGMGQGSTEIAVIEACQLTKQPTFIRCGSSGSLQPEPKLADLAITTSSVRLDNVTSYYVHEGYPATAHPDVVMALARACTKVGAPFHVGITASSPGFYGPQGREIEGFPIRFPNLPDDLAKMGVLNFEMETSTLFVLGTLRKVRTGAVCAIFANRTRNEFADKETRTKAEERCVEASMEAFVVLKEMDAQREMSKTPIWVPA